MKTRIEKDTMGTLEVPAEKYWGAQTQRSKQNFKIGDEGSMPPEIIHAFAVLKKAAAQVNHELGNDPELREKVNEIIEEDYRAFATPLGFETIACVPVSALEGDNIISRHNNRPYWKFSFFNRIYRDRKGFSHKILMIHFCSSHI